MIQKKATLVEIVSDNGYVSFGSVNKHLEGKNRMLRIRDMNDLHNSRRERKKKYTFGGPFRTLASSRIKPLPSMGPNEVATFCSTTPKASPAMISPF